MRVVQGDERGDTGAFAPVDRPRLVDRLGASASFPITLLIAPAGYGKSVALRQYLSTVRERHVRFGLRSEHASLLSFLRGFTEALRQETPHAINALAGAYERATALPKRSDELASWMNAHLESFNGLIAIDDLHIADSDREVSAFLASLIERSKGRIRWVLASRATTNLPLGTWFAYRDADVPIDEEALRFTLEEVSSAAASLGLKTREDELNELLGLTEGWPAAMSFALRTSTRSSDLRNISALTREMIYRFLAEQVYSGLDADERAILEVAVALPIIDVTVLERAGFDRALPIVERLRERTAFIYEESPGVYQCHELFRDFLRHQSALGGKRAQQIVHERAARALEFNGDIEHSIAAYTLAARPDDVVRLLELHGFDMLERARGDIVARAIEALDATRRENATVLALQGTLQAIAGKFPRAESLLRRALARAGVNRDLVALTSLRLATLIGNQGSDVTALLKPVADDTLQRPAYRVEALSLIAARQAIAGDLSVANDSVNLINALLEEIDSNSTRAKILHHLGIVNRHMGDIKSAFRALTESSDLAAELHLYSVGSRANAVLSNLAIHEQDDPALQLEYAERAADAATKAGDAFALQTALLQMLSAHMRRADMADCLELEERFATLRKNDSATQYLALFRSIRLAWEGQFGDAHRLIECSWAKMHLDFDRALSGAQCALFLAVDGSRESSIKLIQEVSAMRSGISVCSLHGTRALALSQVFCALAEAANERFSVADRLVRGVESTDVVIEEALEAAKVIIHMHRNFEKASKGDLTSKLHRLNALGYGDIRLLLESVHDELQLREDHRGQPKVLTTSERHVLRRLAAGLVPKDIALETARSVHTIRVHIASAIEKLGCHGRAEAIRRARQLDLL